MATPHVSGAVAFAAMNFPAESVAQRIQRLLSNVDPVAGLKGVVITGGRLNCCASVDTDLQRPAGLVGADLLRPLARNPSQRRHGWRRRLELRRVGRRHQPDQPRFLPAAAHPDRHCDE